MSNYETSASITLEVNGKNAEDRLKALRQRAEDLENALARARNTGDKIEMNKLQNAIYPPEAARQYRAGIGRMECPDRKNQSGAKGIELRKGFDERT